jgi:hypothetical protein
LGKTSRAGRIVSPAEEQNRLSCKTIGGSRAGRWEMAVMERVRQPGDLVRKIDSLLFNFDRDLLVESVLRERDAGFDPRWC